MWSTESDTAIRTFEHDESEYGVYGASFSSDESRVLTWSEDGTCQLWDVGGLTDLSEDSVNQFVLDTEIRTGATLTHGQYRSLSYDEWTKKIEERDRLVAAIAAKPKIKLAPSEPAQNPIPKQDKPASPTTLKAKSQMDAPEAKRQLGPPEHVFDLVTILAGFIVLVVSLVFVKRC